MPENSKRSFGRWVQEATGISPTLLFDIEEKDSDWALVIKLHAILEAALNQLILGSLRDARLSKIIPKLSTNDDRRGKLAFVKAYDLLPPAGILLVKFLSDVRNDAVHDVSNFNLDLGAYIQRLPPEEIGNCKAALLWFESPPNPDHLKQVLINPRRTLWFACLRVLMSAFNAHATGLELYQNYLAERADAPRESNSKE